MKSGFDEAGSLTVKGGSFGRVFGAAEASHVFGDTAIYVAAEGGKDDGWRLHSPSQIARAYGDLAWKGDKAEARLSISAADNRLTTVGPTPVDLLARDRRAVYTWPQTTHNASALVSASGRWQVAPDWSLSANLYLRRFDQAHVDGNDGDFEGCSSNRSNPLYATLCLQDDAFPRAIRPVPASFQVQNLAGVPVSCPPAVGGARPCAGVAYGTIRIPIVDVIRALSGEGDRSVIAIVRELRLPRVTLAALIGAGLGMSGGALAVLLLAVGGAVAGVLYAAFHNNDLNFGGSVTVVSPTK